LYQVSIRACSFFRLCDQARHLRSLRNLVSSLSGFESSISPPIHNTWVEPRNTHSRDHPSLLLVLVIFHNFESQFIFTTRKISIASCSVSKPATTIMDLQRIRNSTFNKGMSTLNSLSTRDMKWKSLIWAHLADQARHTSSSRLWHQYAMVQRSHIRLCHHLHHGVSLGFGFAMQVQWSGKELCALHVAALQGGPER
jgi:hypothetical protein